jgi:hypothetical protein
VPQTELSQHSQLRPELASNVFLSLTLLRIQEVCKCQCEGQVPGMKSNALPIVI